MYTVEFVVEHVLPVRIQSLFHRDKQEELESPPDVQRPSISRTAVLPGQSRGCMGWMPACTGAGCGSEDLPEVTVCSALFKVEVLELQTSITLKSKPLWALWLLWFQRKAVGFLQTGNKRGIALRTRGSSSVLPQL